MVVGVGCHSPHSRSYRSQVERLRYHPSTDCGSVDSQSDRATATGAMPAGAAMHLLGALNAASIPSFAKGSGVPPRDETASTITAASAACAASTIGSRGIVLPLEVSLCTTATAFVGVLRASRSAGMSGAGPHADETTAAFTRWLRRTSRVRSPKKPLETTITRSPGRKNVYAIASSPAWPGPASGNT